jgi:hypothetical protein
MGRLAREGRSGDQLLIIPHTRRGDGVLADISRETQCRIGAGLRALYADLLAAPVPDRLLAIIRHFDQHEEAEADER